MLTQLLSVMTPDLIIHAIKQNPKVVMETLQKFDTFKLLGRSLTEKQQIVISNNAALVNDFLASEEGRTAIGLWADEFSLFVEKVRKSTGAEPVVVESPQQLEARIRAEVEAKIRAELAASTVN